MKELLIYYNEAMAFTTLNSGTELYRYDLSQPPQTWSTKHKNPEYCFEDYGDKNKAGLFYFFRTENQAVMTANVAKKTKNINSDIWITNCQLTQDVNLLDCRHYTSVVSLLIDFKNNHIDTLTNQYRPFGVNRADYTFGELRKFIEYIEENSSNKDKVVTEKLLLINDLVERKLLLSEANNKVGVLCQQLTDYDNGLVFKQALQSLHFDGYIFNESNGEEKRDTICLIDSTKLSAPNTKKI